MTLPIIKTQIQMFPYPMEGQVEQAIAPHKPGRVKFQSSIWPAQFYQDTHSTAAPSDPIIVIGRRGITLLVQSIDSQ